MGRALDELDQLLDEKDAKIRELEDKIAKMEFKDEWHWRQLRVLSDEENLGLPIPRLEIRHRKTSKYTTFMDYGIVYRHLLGEITFVPLSCTKTSGHTDTDRELLRVPFRDGAHILSDMYELKLRGFVVEDDKFRELSLLDLDKLPTALANRITRDAEDENSKL
jgi:hypothetical protein